MGKTAEKITLTIKKSLNDIEAEQWDLLLSDDKKSSIYSSTSWLNMTAKSDGIPQTYLLASKNEIIYGGLTFDIMPKSVPIKYNVQSIIEGNSSEWDDLPKNTVTSDLMPSLSITNRGAKTCDFKYREGLTRKETKELLSIMIEFLETYAMKEGCNSISFLFVGNSLEILNEVLESKNYTQFTAGASYYIPIHKFKEFEDYVKGLISKRRNVVRSELKKAKEANVEYEMKKFEDNLTVFVDHFEYNYLKYHDQFNYESYYNRMRLLAEEFGDRAFSINMKIENKVVGSTLFLHNKNSIIARSVGISPEVPPKIAPYFNLAYYEGIRTAMNFGADYVDFGGGLDETKLSRGCEMEKQSIYIKSFNEELPISIIDYLHNFIKDKLDGFFKNKYSNKRN